jgi:hypothetical protein
MLVYWEAFSEEELASFGIRVFIVEAGASSSTFVDRLVMLVRGTWQTYESLKDTRR